MSDVIRIEIAERVATLTICRPEKLNALDPTIVRELTEAFGSLSASPAEVRAAILTGEGKAFVAGADIAAMANMTSAEAKRFADAGHRLGATIEEAAFPVIAAVNGFALGGGCELALACDFIIASEKAKFGQPEVKLGVIPGFGGTQRLARRVGLGHARQLCFTGDILTADEAKAIGLVNAVVPADALLREAGAIASRIAAQGPLAVAAAKRVMLRGVDVPLPVANELEAQAFAQLFGSDDQREGMRAFIEKKQATFKGT
ncbi:MAG: enoyl-CoA hydratase-related protein [Polyangiaceae bacterium]